MRICLLARNNFVDDPRARALHASLQRAGHDVQVVASGRRPEAAPRTATYVPTRRPVGRGKLGKYLRQVQPTSVRERLHRRGLVAAVRAMEPDLVYPTSAHMVEVAAEAVSDRGAVVRDPSLPPAGPRDLIELAPGRPELSVSPAGPGVPYHGPGDDRGPWEPQAGRYAGQRIALAYRKTDRNPGRYLEDALRRAGFEILLHTDRIDLDELPPDTRAVVFVEGPLPPIEVVGSSPGFPVLFWVHHGEHHLQTNLRLLDRYRADAVLLAHSWHLAHRFPVPVHRFPFGTDPDLFGPTRRPWEERDVDVAMVGAHLAGGGPYQRRGDLVRACEAAVDPGRRAFLEGVTPEEMARTYGRARIVLNEGGVRHHPITMRVFEAISAGALLLTDPVPGLDQLFEPEREYRLLADDIGAQVRSLAASPETDEVARRAFERGRARHTYDHRVDELLDIVQATSVLEKGDPAPSTSGLAALVESDVEVQRILSPEQELAASLPDREVWHPDRVRRPLRPATYEAVAIATDDVAPHAELLRAAWRYLYVRGAARGLERFVADEWPEARVARSGDLARVDLAADSYRLEAVEGGQ
jgi:hypothetical protein